MKRKSGIPFRRKESLTSNSTKETGCPQHIKILRKAKVRNSPLTLYLDEKGTIIYGDNNND